MSKQRITVWLLRLKAKPVKPDDCDDAYFTQSPRVPKKVFTLGDDCDTTVETVENVLDQPVKEKPKYSLDNQNTLAFFFKHTDGKDCICPAEMQATVSSLDCDKIVFVEKKLQNTVEKKWKHTSRFTTMVGQSPKQIVLVCKTYSQTTASSW
jgi:hypothetical protein